MISRRRVLVGGSGLAVAWVALPAEGAAPGKANPALSLFLFDRSIGGAAAADAADRAGVTVAGFREDVGVPWLDVIEPMWRHAPQPIAGITHGGALFCLEQLGHSHGLACTVRLAIPQPANDRLEAAALSLLDAAAGPFPVRRRLAAGQLDTPVAWLLQPIARNDL